MELDSIGKYVSGVWLPKGEVHLTDWMLNSKGRYFKDDVATYQWSKQNAAMGIMRQYIPYWNQRSFIDVGAHVGLWSMWWGPIMKAVVAFEPIPPMRDLYRANMVGRGHYHLSATALGSAPGKTALMFNPENTGNTHAARAGETGLEKIMCEVTTLDLALGSLSDFPIPGVIKIDCEGVEEAVVRGGEQTIKAHRPLIIVEQKKGAAYYGSSPLGAVDLLRGWGYHTVKEMSGDYIMANGEPIE